MAMEPNANFDERVSVHAAKIRWKASPMPGVERRMFDRPGDDDRPPRYFRELNSKFRLKDEFPEDRA
jgi:hypothetical protein